jgi:hypothetical protein
MLNSNNPSRTSWHHAILDLLQYAYKPLPKASEQHALLETQRQQIHSTEIWLVLHLQ